VRGEITREEQALAEKELAIIRERKAAQRAAKAAAKKAESEL